MGEYSIYCHTNKTNGKRYVGLSKSPETRWNNGLGYKRQQFFKAIEEYGWDGFFHEIIESGLALDEANSREQFYIAKFDSANPEHGYNITKGGCHCELSEIGRKNLSEAIRATYREHPEIMERQSQRMKLYYAEHPEAREALRAARTGTKASEEAKRKMSESRKGRKHTPEAIQKMRDSKAGWRPSEETIENMRVAAKKRSENRSEKVDRALREAAEKKRRPVCRYDLDGNLIAEYSSVREAERETGTTHNSIVLCCQGKRRVAKGSVWRYKESR